jgi:hypothetical protein
MKANQVKQIIDAGLEYAKGFRFAGYDPYDALNTRWRLLTKGKWWPVILIQIMKRLPINLRPLLGIPRLENPKGLGLFLETYALLEKAFPGQYRSDCDYLISRLAALRTPGFSGVCWGYHFDWASPVKVLKAGSPTVVVTGFIAKALYEVIQLREHKEAEELFLAIDDFIEQDLPFFHDNTGMCISYSTVVQDCCYNASLLAAGYYARLYHFRKNPEHMKKATDLVNFVVSRQNEDGSWHYSVNLKTGKPRIQTDFHQGFVLDSILEAMHFMNVAHDHWRRAIEKGSAFYLNQQFTTSGATFFRYPRRYPADVHHQAQGMITACKLEDAGFVTDNKAKKMAEWAAAHLYNGKGRFYYRKYRLFTDRTTYMRWGQGWMMLAFTRYYLQQIRNGKDE